MEKRREPRLKILVVDDTPDNLLILGDELHGEYEVFVAINGATALKMVKADPPDLILLDIMMPGMDGYEVCRCLKDDQATSHIPIIFITAMDTEEEETRGLAAGAVDYITKPFRLPIVKARVRTHLELKRKTDMLQNLSSRDGLTGSANRRRFDEVLKAEWQRALHNQWPLSLILLDIDNFKRYNDTYGHLAGDLCLQQVAQTLNNMLRRVSDFLARYGGEEFVIVLPETGLDQALVVAERVRNAVETQQIVNVNAQAAPYVTISVGVATLQPTLATTPQVLIDAADKALYAAKQAGRNRVMYRIL